MKQELPMAAMFLTDRDKISNLYRAPSIYISYQVSVHLAKQFRIRRFLEIDQSETSIAYGGHVCLCGRSSMTIAHFVPIRLQAWPPQAILVFDWSIYKNLLL
jgi:hypothetical protein